MDRALSISPPAFHCLRIPSRSSPFAGLLRNLLYTKSSVSGVKLQRQPLSPHQSNIVAGAFDPSCQPLAKNLLDGADHVPNLARRRFTRLTVRSSADPFMLFAPVAPHCFHFRERNCRIGYAVALQGDWSSSRSPPAQTSRHVRGDLLFVGGLNGSSAALSFLGNLCPEYSRALHRFPPHGKETPEFSTSTALRMVQVHPTRFVPPAGLPHLFVGRRIYRVRLGSLANLAGVRLRQGNLFSIALQTGRCNSNKNFSLDRPTKPRQELYARRRP